jgi:hypothetical protein
MPSFSSSFSSPGSGPRVAGFIVGGIGLVLGAAGYVVWRYVPGMVAAEHARLAALPTPDAISLTDTPAGREVLVEGRIAPDQPVRFRNFVAYVKEEEQRDQRERERSGNWKTVETVTPPLHLIVDGGSAHVVNASYAIHFAATQWRDTARVIDTNYSGLVSGEGVFVRGRAAPGGIEAITVGSGTRASYLATVAGNAAVGWWLGVGFMAVGTLMVTIALVLFVTAARQARRARQPVPWPPEPGAAR